MLNMGETIDSETGAIRPSRIPENSEQYVIVDKKIWKEFKEVVKKQHQSPTVWLNRILGSYTKAQKEQRNWDSMLAIKKNKRELHEYSGGKKKEKK